jgi:hypothetical protein
VEVCDSYDIDEDCNGKSEERDPGLVDATWWFPDEDGDTYGERRGGELVCDQPDGWLLDEVIFCVAG